jgi:RNA polymerase sigma factor (sigma-70 family)
MTPESDSNSGDAFGRALMAEAPIVLAVARATLMHESDAWDVLQTTLEIAIKRRDQLRNPLALRAWLLTIESRECFKLRRRLKRMVSLDDSVAEFRFSSGSQFDVVAVREALDELPPRTRQAVVLRHLAGLSVAEVASASGTSVNTVRSQLKTGLRRLREESA